MLRNLYIIQEESKKKAEEEAKTKAEWLKKSKKKKFTGKTKLKNRLKFYFLQFNRGR